ncbi:hypothetical protein KIPB_011254 [Kipferlia bialata]|uniref:Uncharacterized protein n=1 Tax=Kipferlia bialata TaxID=797122 RepID=A0A391P6H9_9EUKA|nr:hypothetical protein KIPB_011254 [Kipferlia bialata]|eukprot:g11254.t1
MYYSDSESDDGHLTDGLDSTLVCDGPVHVAEGYIQAPASLFKEGYIDRGTPLREDNSSFFLWFWASNSNRAGVQFTVSCDQTTGQYAFKPTAFHPYNLSSRPGYINACYNGIVLNVPHPKDHSTVTASPLIKLDSALPPAHSRALTSSIFSTACNQYLGEDGSVVQLPGNLSLHPLAIPPGPFLCVLGDNLLFFGYYFGRGDPYSPPRMTLLDPETLVPTADCRECPICFQVEAYTVVHDTLHLLGNEVYQSHNRYTGKPVQSQRPRHLTYSVSRGWGDEGSLPFTPARFMQVRTCGRCILVLNKRHLHLYDTVSGEWARVSSRARQDADRTQHTAVPVGHDGLLVFYEYLLSNSERYSETDTKNTPKSGIEATLLVLDDTFIYPSPGMGWASLLCYDKDRKVKLGLKQRRSRWR